MPTSTSCMCSSFTRRLGSGILSIEELLWFGLVTRPREYQYEKTKLVPLYEPTSIRNLTTVQRPSRPSDSSRHPSNEHSLWRSSILSSTLGYNPSGLFPPFADVISVCMWLPAAIDLHSRRRALIPIYNLRQPEPQLHITRLDIPLSFTLVLTLRQPVEHIRSTRTSSESRKPTSQFSEILRSSRSSGSTSIIRLTNTA